MRAWSAALGEDTFVGSSGRVFPKSFKASPLLRAWLKRLAAAGVAFRFRHKWTGWTDAGALRFDTPDGPLSVAADATVLALGGASWPRLGSDGGWADIVRRDGHGVAALLPANCGFVANWSAPFRDRFAGQPLKRIALSFAGQTVRGEATVTADGLEGGAIYALSGPLRDAILADGKATLTVSFCPDLPAEVILQRLGRPRGKQSLSNVLRKALHLTPAAIGLLHESLLGSAMRLTALSDAELAARIHAVPVDLVGISPLAGAISTAGGLSFAGLDDTLMLRGRAGVFAAGEMLDWEAPTGGYLLQAAFATGAAAGRGALEWLAAEPQDGAFAAALLPPQNGLM